MAHLWIENDVGGEGLRPAWRAVPLAGARVRVSDGCASTAAGDGGDEPGVLVPAGDGWVVIGSPAIHVNGLALRLGMQVLRDCDELLVAGRRLFFSTEVLAAVVPFPAASADVRCPRCQQVIEPTTPAVHCPQCGVWHHQSQRLPCWTYGAACALCDQPSDLDGSYRWTPEEL